MEGIIVKNISDIYTVKYSNERVNCKAKGIFRRNNITPTVGDHVLFDLDKKIITKIFTRNNILIRPPVSNVDQALIVMSAKEPEFSTNLLDKLLCVIEFNNIKPIICLSKMDLLKSTEEISKHIDYYRSLGYTVIINTDYNELKKILENKITVITGQSGVGKSTLLNHLDSNLSLKTDNISISLGRGKHTTRHVELIELYGGLVADTPGFSALSFISMTKENIRDNIREFNKYKDKCRYKDCMHIKEDDCYIKELVNKDIILNSRYENYKKFINEIKNQKMY